MKKILLLSFAALGLGALAALLLWPRTEPTSSEAPVLAEASDWPLGLRFAPGQLHRFAFTYTQQVKADAMPTPTGPGVQQNASAVLGGDVALAGHFTLEGRSAPRGDGAAELLMRFEGLSQHRFNLQGQSLLPDAETVQAQLLGEAALVKMSARGEVQEISFGEQAHPMFERLVQLVLSESQLSLEPVDRTWQREERGLHGHALTDYDLRSKDAQRAVVQKRRTSYQELQALPLHEGELRQQLVYQLSAQISRQGMLESLRGEERLTASSGGRDLLALHSSLTIKHVGSAPGGQATASAFSKRRALGEIGLSEEVERKELRERAEGLTREQMKADLERFGFGAQMPDHNKWLWRSAALIRLEPELVDDLVEFFQSKKIRHEGRALALDLLVGAQTYRAQQGILTALHTPAALQDDRYPLLFQRINLLTHPSPETIAFLEQTQVRGKGMQPALATNALGSAAGHLVRAGELERGQAIGNRLLAQLREQRSPEDQALYLTALGNAALPNHAEVLRGYASVPSSKVRWQTAASLRKFKDDASRATLLELVADPVERVQIRALESLHARKDLSAKDRRQISELVSARRLAEIAYNPMITVLAPHLASDPTVRSTFDTVLAQDVHVDIKARVRGIYENQGIGIIR